MITNSEAKERDLLTKAHQGIITILGHNIDNAPFRLIFKAAFAALNLDQYTILAKYCRPSAGEDGIDMYPLPSLLEKRFEIVLSSYAQSEIKQRFLPALIEMVGPLVEAGPDSQRAVNILKILWRHYAVEGQSEPIFSKWGQGGSGLSVGLLPHQDGEDQPPPIPALITPLDDEPILDKDRLTEGAFGAAGANDEGARLLAAALIGQLPPELVQEAAQYDEAEVFETLPELPSQSSANGLGWTSPEEPTQGQKVTPEPTLSVHEDSTLLLHKMLCTLKDDVRGKSKIDGNISRELLGEDKNYYATWRTLLLVASEVLNPDEFAVMVQWGRPPHMNANASYVPLPKDINGRRKMLREQTPEMFDNARQESIFRKVGDSLPTYAQKYPLVGKAQEILKHLLDSKPWYSAPIADPSKVTVEDLRDALRQFLDKDARLKSPIDGTLAAEFLKEDPYFYDQYRYVLDVAGRVLNIDEFAVFALYGRPPYMNMSAKASGIETPINLPLVITKYRKDLRKRHPSIHLATEKIIRKVFDAVREDTPDILPQLGDQALVVLQSLLGDKPWARSPHFLSIQKSAKKMGASSEGVDSSGSNPLALALPSDAPAPVVALGSDRAPAPAQAVVPVRQDLRAIFEREAKYVQKYTIERNILDLAYDFIQSARGIDVLSQLCLRRPEHRVGSFAELAAQTSEEEFVLRAVFDRTVAAVRETAATLGLHDIAKYPFTVGQDLSA